MDWLERLNELKKKAGKTTDDVVRLSGISKGTLNKLFAGQTKDPQLSTISAVVHCLGYTLDDLDVEYETPPTEQSEGGEYREYIDLIKKLPPEQRIEVKGYLKHLVYEYEAAEAAKQISDVV